MLEYDFNFSCVCNFVRRCFQPKIEDGKKGMRWAIRVISYPFYSYIIRKASIGSVSESISSLMGYMNKHYGRKIWFYRKGSRRTI